MAIVTAYPPTIANGIGYLYITDVSNNVITTLKNNLLGVNKILRDGLVGQAPIPSFTPDGIVANVYGHRYYLSPISGALQGDIINPTPAIEITQFVVNKGLQTFINKQNLSIVSGEITPTRINLITVIEVDTEGGAGADDLDTIVSTGFVDEDIIILEGKNSNNITTVKNNTGNIILANGIDFSTGNTPTYLHTFKITLQYNSTEDKFYEIGRSPNIPLTVANLRATGIPQPVSGEDLTTILSTGLNVVYTAGVNKGTQIFDSGSSLLLTGNVTIDITGGTPLDGDEFWIDYRATLDTSSSDPNVQTGGFPVVIGGIVLTPTQALQGRTIIKAKYKLSNTTWYYELFERSEGRDLVDSIQLATKENLLPYPAISGMALVRDTLIDGGAFSYVSLPISGTGTVTSVSVTPNQGISGVVTSPTTTPSIIISIGALTSVTSYNGMVITANNGTVTTGIWNATPVSEVYGGTNQSSYTTGDLLYASASNTISKRAIGTTGQVLTVVGGVPTWDTPVTGGITTLNSLTALTQSFATSVGTGETDFTITSSVATHTFILPIASATNTGKLSSTDWSTFNSKFTLPALTSGSVLFSDGSTIAQSNADLYWDNATKKLGIGTNSPSTIVHIGQSGLTEGTLGIAGLTSGLVTIKTATVAGTWTLTLPPDAGTNGYVLQTDGAGVTTWAAVSSGGITSLNGLTNGIQTFAVGTSGTDFNISSVTSTHTFNIPDAGVGERGLVTNGSQTFGGTKTFSAVIVTATASLTLGTSSSATGQIILNNSTNANTLTLQSGATSSSYTLTLPLAQGAASTFLQNDGTGILSWVAAPSGSGTTSYVTRWSSSSSLGIGIIQDNSSTVSINIAPSGTAMLYVKGSDATVSNSTLRCINSASTTTFEVRNNGQILAGVVSSLNLFIGNGVIGGTNNTFVGINSPNGTITGSYNSAFGAGALYAITSSSRNTAFGYLALSGVTTGTGSNVGVGADAGKNISTGTNNCAVGDAAMGFSGTLTGSNNLAFGQFALGSLTGVASRNTAIGASTGNTFATGTDCIFIGYLAQVATTLTAMTSSIVIGNNAVARANNQLVIGAVGTSTTQINEAFVGRGVSTTAANLGTFTLSTTGINGSNITDVTAITDGSAATSIFYIAGARGTGTGTGGAITFQVAPAGVTGNAQNALVDIMTIYPTNSNVGIGTTTPNASAILDLVSTTKGLKIPSMTGLQADAITGVDALLVYINTANGTFGAVGFWGYVSGTWTQL